MVSVIVKLLRLVQKIFDSIFFHFWQSNLREGIPSLLDQRRTLPGPARLG
jgi:hypothetical protein